MKVFKKKHVDKKSKIDNFSKNLMLLANFAKIDTVKLKKPRKLGVLTSGIKRDGHKRKIRELGNPGIRSSGNYEERLYKNRSNIICVWNDV